MNEYRQESDADSTSSEFYFSDETEEHDDGFKNAMKMLTIKRQEEVGRASPCSDPFSVQDGISTITKRSLCREGLRCPSGGEDENGLIECHRVWSSDDGCNYPPSLKKPNSNNPGKSMICGHCTLDGV